MTDASQDDNFTRVISKNSLKRAKAQAKQQRVQFRQMQHDLRYLLTHVGFQKHRIRKADYNNLKNCSKGDLLILSGHRCVGHPIDVIDGGADQECLQCHWKLSSDFIKKKNVKVRKELTPDGTGFHCCCTDEIRNDLPLNFYLGCDGKLEEFLYMMGDYKENR